jgi:Trm5-related predicted tRNA methylase
LDLLVLGGMADQHRRRTESAKVIGSDYAEGGCDRRVGLRASRVDYEPQPTEDRT